MTPAAGRGGPRVGGVIFTNPNLKSVVTGNYVDNCFFELTNEHDANPDFSNEYSFGGITFTGNIFTANDVANWFTWFVIKPYGPGHFIHGLSVTGNTFKAINGAIDRIERVDDSIAPLDYTRTRNVTFSGNTFNGVSQRTINPVTLEFDQPSNERVWTLNVSGYLPFDGYARTVSSVVTEGKIENEANETIYAFPYVWTNVGAGQDHVQLTWPEKCRGTVQVTARVDKPV